MEEACCVIGCPRFAHAKGLCLKHYQAHRRNRLVEPTAERQLRPKIHTPRQPKEAALREVKEREAALEKPNAVNAEYVIGQIVEIIKYAKESADFAAALKGLDMLGRHLGLWARAEITATLTLAEIIQRAARKEYSVEGQTVEAPKGEQ